MFGRPIGQNQAIQHPLAECWMRAEAAELMVLQGGAASTTPASRAAPRPTPPSISRAEAGFDACEARVLTHGGMGYAKEYHVERYLREVMMSRHRAGQRAS